MLPKKQNQITGLVLTPIVPESPVWLVHKGWCEKARTNLLLTRTSSSVDACEAALEEEAVACAARGEGGGVEEGGCGQMCERRAARRGLSIMIGLMFAQQWSGINAVSCFVLQLLCAAVCCNVLHCVAVCWSVLQSAHDYEWSYL